MTLELVTIPCLADNFAYLVRDPDVNAVALIDAPEADPVLRALDERGWSLDQILITHHHADHTGGVDALRRKTGARVLGPAREQEQLPRLDGALGDSDTVRVGHETGTVIAVPGHTGGHVAYHFAASALAFTGDSLMAAGCGRVFEGTPEEMWESLARLSRLPGATRVCSGHDYLDGNLRFALTLEPGSEALARRVERVARMRDGGQPPMPWTLDEELATNPFLRANLPVLKAAIDMPGTTDARAFAEIRRRKDHFS